MGAWLIEWGLILLAAWTAIPRGSALRPPTFEDRVRAQEAVERVYYNHRIWPKENPGPKPPFEQMISKAQVEAKVEDYLKKSVALDKFWQRPIQTEQLQAEMDRMARQTQDPETLQELFAALDKDPYRIAECLARPVLADRLIRNWYAFDTRFHKEAREQGEKSLMNLSAGCDPTQVDQYKRAKYVRDTSGTALRSKMQRGEISPLQEIPLDDAGFDELHARLPGASEPLRIQETREHFIIGRVLHEDSTSIDIEEIKIKKKAFDLTG